MIFFPFCVKIIFLFFKSEFSLKAQPDLYLYVVSISC